MIDNKSVQRYLVGQKAYTGAIDGIIGAGSLAGLRAVAKKKAKHYSDTWTDQRCRIAVEQAMMEELAGAEIGDIDGALGPLTQHGYEVWQNYLRDRPLLKAEPEHPNTVWPRQSGVPAFFGKPGANLALFDLPYPMRLAWDTDTIVKRITLNKKVGESAQRAFKAALDHYGLPGIQQLGLDLYGGSYANRKMRGGQAVSMHAYGIAIDIDTENNQLRWNHTKARMAQPAYAAFLDCWYAEGWINLGRERDFDWQHFQAARL